MINYPPLTSAFLGLGNAWRILIPLMVVLSLMSGCAGRQGRTETPTPAEIRAKAWAPYAQVLSAALTASKSDTERSYQPGQGGHCDELLTYLIEVARTRGRAVEVWPVAVLSKVFAQNRGVVYGSASADEKTFMVAMELESCGRAEVLAHELAHLVAVNAPVSWSNPDQQEVFMDLVQWGWLAALGYDSREATVTYLSFYVTPEMGTEAAWQDAVLASVAAGVASTRAVMPQSPLP